MRSIQVAALTAAALIGAASCGKAGSATAGGGEGGHSDTGAGAGGATSTTGTGGTPAMPNVCMGQCVPTQPDGWDYPDIVWFGDVDSAPPCPPDTYMGYLGNSGLQAPIDCGTCACGAAAGSCTLPTTMTANAATCAENVAATPHTSFDPASGWTGGCDSNDAIPSGKLCSGVHCVQSLTVGALAVNESACTPSQPPAQSAPTWTTVGFSCRIVQGPVCPNPVDSCTAPAPPQPGFRLCVFAFEAGVIPCSDVSAYSEQHVFYEDFQDTRSCSDCTCGAPSGGSCSSDVSIYADGACSTSTASVTVDSTGPTCVDVPSGAALGSKSASTPTHTPGSCSPGGGMPMGAATPIQASTFCCLPP
jgi:hypothetical protein